MPNISLVANENTDGESVASSTDMPVKLMQMTTEYEYSSGKRMVGERVGDIEGIEDGLTVGVLVVEVGGNVAF